MRLSGTTFCLDAGTRQWSINIVFLFIINVPLEPGNGDELKIWHCQGNLPGQQWQYTSDNRIKLKNQGMTPSMAVI